VGVSAAFEPGSVFGGFWVWGEGCYYCCEGEVLDGEFYLVDVVFGFYSDFGFVGALVVVGFLVELDGLEVFCGCL